MTEFESCGSKYSTTNTGYKTSLSSRNKTLDQQNARSITFKAQNLPVITSLLRSPSQATTVFGKARHCHSHNT